MTEPRIAPETIHNAPVSTVGDNSPQAHASVQDRAGLYIAIVALIMATLALGLEIQNSRTTDAKIAAGVAEARAQMSEQLAKAQADMHLAETNALLAKDRTDKIAAALEARGLIKLENH